MMIKLRFDNDNLNICNVCITSTECQMKAIGCESELPLSTTRSRRFAHRETIWNMDGPTPENLEETIVLRLNEESEHSTSVQKRFFSRGDVAFGSIKSGSWKRRSFRFLSVTFAKMALIGVRGWWAYTRRISNTFPIFSPLSFSLSLSRRCLLAQTLPVRRVKAIRKVFRDIAK